MAFLLQDLVPRSGRNENLRTRKPLEGTNDVRQERASHTGREDIGALLLSGKDDLCEVFSDTLEL